MLFKIEKYRGTHLVRVPLVAAVSLVVMVVGLSIMLWSAERGRAARLQVKQPGEFSALLPSIVGLTQGAKPPLSSWHWRVTVGSGSEKVKLASPLPLGFGGPKSIVGAGG